MGIIFVIHAALISFATLRPRVSNGHESFALSDALALAQGALVIFASIFLFLTRSHSKILWRPGHLTGQLMMNAAKFMLAALMAVGLGAVALAVPTSLLSPAIGDVLTLLGPVLLLGCAMALPNSQYTSSQKRRVALDGSMIMIGAATFAWFFVLGPGLTHHWASQATALSHIAYPLVDLLIVAALLVVSAKSADVAGSRWWPLAAGMAMVVVADTVRQVGIEDGLAVASDAAAIIRLGSSILLAVGVVGFIRYQQGADLYILHDADKEAPKPAPADDARASEPTHMWDSLLPFGLVPCCASLAVYAWEKDLNSGITGGIVVGTALLVTLAFYRQLLSVQDNLMLYKRVHTAYQESLAHLDNIGALNEKLKQAQDQLQAKNDHLAQLNLGLQAQATTDLMTGLPNHRSMVLALDQELERSARYSRPCSLLFLDLDHFKALNDGCGHLAGDNLLREIVSPILEGLRTADIAGRWGGEEFVVLMPETDLEDALIAAERIRELVALHRFSVAGGMHLTCSIGVASYPRDGTNRDALVEAADSAMYAAKRLGRNQVRSAIDPSVIGLVSDAGTSASREELLLQGMMEALTTIVKAYDPQEDAQSRDIAELAGRVSTSLGLSGPEVRIINVAARLHDIGMVAVPQATLRKTTAFDSDDWSAVVAHPIVGADAVSNIPALSVIAPLIRSHHERCDGTGYPDGLHRDEIPMGARIIAACAAFSAMTSEKRKPKRLSTEEAVWELEDGAGTQFDPDVVVALRDIVLQDASVALLRVG